MNRVIFSLVLICAGTLAFAQETNAPTPAPVVEAKKYPEPVKISGLIRSHYDIAVMSNANTQKWGNFSFYYLTLKAQASLAENLNAEMGIDMGSFAGQRAITNIATSLQVEKLFETAFLQYKVDPLLVITAGRMWDFYAPWVFSQQTRDGLGLTGSVLGGMFKYGAQVFNDTILFSPYFPLIEFQLGVMPIKGLTLDGAMFIAANGDLKKNGYSVNFKASKLEFLPELALMHEFSLVNTTNTSTVPVNITGYDDYTLVGWQIGSVQPFVELFLGDVNVDANITNDNYMYMRFAVKWDVTPNFAVVPYLRVDFLKSGVVPADTVSFRLRLDCKF